MRSLLLIWFITIFSAVSCNNQPEKRVLKQRPGKSELADVNTYFVQKDRERIQNYIERKHLPMKESVNGLWYYISNEGTGNYFAENDKVTYNYICSLLDGTICYDSGKLGPKECILGKSEMESGLNEGLRLLKPGGEAIFILPPFLAYGLVGDGKSIPSRATVVYKIKIRNTR